MINKENYLCKKKMKKEVRYKCRNTPVQNKQKLKYMSEENIKGHLKEIRKKIEEYA